jgi:Tfp pilus assembly protein PilN
MTELSQAPRKPLAPPSRSGNRPRVRRWLLAGLAAVLAVLAVVLGALLLPGASSPATVRSTALTRSQAAYAAVQRAVGRLAAADRACHEFTCQISIDRQTVRDYLAFAAAIRAIPMPAGSPSVAARQLEQAATQTALAGGTLAAARSAAQLHSLEAISPSMADIVQVQQDSGYLRYLLARR